MHARDTVTIVLCTYNGAAFIEQQMSSFLVQTRLPDELILADDASTDRTLDLAAPMVATARSRGVAVHIIGRTQRLGYVANFSDALSRASGQIVFLSDQDDAWHPDKIARMCACFQQRPELTLLHSNAQLVDAAGERLGVSLFDALEFDRDEMSRLRRGDAFDVYLRRNLATGAATALRQSLLEVALPVPACWVHDAWLAAMAAACGTVDVIEEDLIDYRQHGGNQIGMAARTWRMRLADMVGGSGSLLVAELGRLDALAERLGRCSAGSPVLASIEDMRRHIEARVSMNGMNRWARLPLIAREWTTGRYRTRSTGWHAALRDLLRTA